MEKKQNQVKIMNKEQNEDVDNEKHADKVRTREGPDVRNQLKLNIF